MIILIIGSLGVGKSSLACNFVIKAMDNGKEQLKQAENIINSKYPGYKNIKLPENHLVYTDMGVKGSEYRNSDIRPYVTNGFRFGLRNSDYETDDYPYGSILVFDEARKYWDSRKSMLSYEKGGTHPKALEMFELSRQNGLNIILVSQLENHIDNRIVNLAQLVICPVNFVVDRFGDKLKRTMSVWDCLLFNNLDEYKMYKADNKSVVPRKETFKFNGNIFNHYDSEYFQFRFLAGLEEYSKTQYEEHDGSVYSIEKLNSKFEDTRHSKNIKKNSNLEWIE